MLLTDFFNSKFENTLPFEHLETVHVSELVAVYAEGKLGFWIYEQFSDIVAAAVDMKRQHTPNLEKHYTYIQSVTSI